MPEIYSEVVSSGRTLEKYQDKLFNNRLDSIPEACTESMSPQKTAKMTANVSPMKPDNFSISQMVKLNLDKVNMQSPDRTPTMSPKQAAACKKYDGFVENGKNNS